MLWHSKKSNEKLIEFCSKEDVEMDKVLFIYAKKAMLFHAKNHKNNGIMSKDEFEKTKNILNNLNIKKFSIKDEDIQTYILRNIKERDENIYKKLRAFFSRNEHSLNTEILFAKSFFKEVDKELENTKKEIKKILNKSKDLPWLYQTHFREGTLSKTKYWIKAYLDWIDFTLKNNKAMNLTLFYGTGPGGGSSMYKGKFSPMFSQHVRGILQQEVMKHITDISIMLSKFSWDVILYSMLGYIELEFSFGSSAMPHKKNPDPLELIRANHHEIISNLSAIYSLYNLPSGYHRDFQKGKEIMIKSSFVILKELKVVGAIIKNMKFDEKKLEKLKENEKLYSFEELSEEFLNGIGEEMIYHKWQKGN